MKRTARRTLVAFSAALLAAAAAPSAEPEKARATKYEGFVLVQAGSFQMGDLWRDSPWAMQETPVREVEVDDFLLAKHELTVPQFERFVKATGHKTAAEAAAGTQANRGFLKDGRQFYPSWRAHWFKQGLDHPVVMVAWEDAIVYCNWLSRQHQVPAACPLQKQINPCAQEGSSHVVRGGMWDTDAKACRSSARMDWYAKAYCAGSGFRVALTVEGAKAGAQSNPRRPNVVFILADDLGYGDLGCYGQTKIRTPNIDRMAAEGLRFTQHYAGSAVCAPSRCVLMTGRHPGHAHVRDNRGYKPEGQEPLPPDAVTLPRLLHLGGYVTGGFGKWGLGGPGTSGDPLKQGIDRWFGYNCQSVAHNYYPTYLWDNDKKLALSNPAFSAYDRLKPGEDPNDPKSYRRFQGSQYSADLIAEQARKFIRDNKDRPFFCYVPTTVPHLALQVPDDSLAEYLGRWDDPPYQGGKGYLPHFAPRAAYAAMITRMDREIGRIMDLVRELGLDEDTIFVFSSDNGPLSGVHQGLAGTDAAFFNSGGGLRNGKGTLYEGGIRVPAIVRWKGKIKPGTVSDRVTGFEDWLPTLLELADLKDKTPAGIDGISFAPTLHGNRQPERPFLYREFPAYGGQQCIRVGDWKAVRQNLQSNRKALAGGSKPTMEVYNIAADPREEHDVAASHPEVVARLSRIMKEQHTPSKEFPFAALDK